jgi:hypothetical protein
MANRYAVATGNWSNVATWDGGTTLPQAGDVVRSNSYTVTIDQDITVTSLQNSASAPAVAGGSFVITATTTRTITADLIGLASQAYLLRLQSTGIVNIIGNSTISGNATASGSCISVEANSTLNYTGNGTGGSNAANYGVTAPTFKITSATGCTLNFTGIYTGGGTFDVTQNSCIEITGNGVIVANITGSLIGGTQSACLLIRGTLANVVVNGIIQSSSTAPAILVLPTITSTITNSVRVGGVITNVNGVSAISSNVLKLSSAVSQSWIMQTENALVNKTLYSANLLTGYPLVANVEDGVVYGPSSEFTGTLNPVTVNVTVDTNAIASAISTSLETSLPPLLAPPLATDLLAEISTSADPLAERLRNASTVQTTGAQLQSLVIAP